MGFQARPENHGRAWKPILQTGDSGEPGYQRTVGTISPSRDN